MRRNFVFSVFILGALVSQSGLCANAIAPDPPRFLEWPQELKEVGFRSIEKIWGTRPIKRGASVYPLPLAEQQVTPKVTVGGTDFTIDTFMTANQVSGLLAIKNGRIVLERYGLNREPEDRWISWSVAKSVTSTLVGAAIQDGHIQSLDDMVTNYIPELKGSAYDVVTLRQLLTMTSGVEWNEDYSNPDSDIAKGLALPPTDCGINSVVSYVRDLPRVAPPGTRYNYNSAETDLLGLVLSKATGKTISSYLSEKIWAPFGMEAEALWNVDTSGHEAAAGSVIATLRDYGRFGLFMLGGGKAAGKQILPVGWVQEATSAHIKDSGYGYQWWIGNPPNYKALGIFGQAIYVIPEQQLVVAINSAWSSHWDNEKFVRQEHFVKAIIDALQ